MSSRSLWLAVLALVLALPADARETRCKHPTEAVTETGSPSAEAMRRGNALLRAGEAADALRAYEEAGAFAQAEGEERVALLASANAGRAALEAGQLPLATKRLDAVARSATGQPPMLRATLLVHVARSFAAWPDTAADRAEARLRAAELFTKAEVAAAEAEDARLRSFALGWLGELYEAGGRLDEARTLTRRALVQAGRADAPDAMYRWYWQLGRIERAAGNDQAALADYRKAVAQVDVMRGALALGPVDAALSFRTEVVPVYLGLVDLLLVRAAAQPSGETRQRLLAEARDTLEAEKAAELRDHFRDECLAAQRKATPDDVPGAVVYYPVVLEDRVELIVSRNGELQLYRAPVTPSELVTSVRAMRQLLTKRTTRQYLPHAQKLYDWLIRPIAPSLEGGGVEAFVVVPSGSLRTIPFSALHDRESDRFLIERFPVAVVPGLTLTEPRPIDRAKVETLAAGITKGIFGFSALDNVDEELDRVAALFPGTRLEDATFTTAAFQQTLATQPIGIVHIASHGEFRAEASRSFLLSWSGEVPMDEVGEIVGQTRFRTDQPLELLTLSACQTAAGDDRAALGLAGVALQAGARSALATLWSVNDQATAVLIAEFYTQLRKPDVSRAVALQRAQQKLLADPRFRHPAYWSAFLIISSWL